MSRLKTKEVGVTTKEVTEHPLLALEKISDIERVRVREAIRNSIADETDPFFAAAISGDIDTLYTIIEQDLSCLEHANAVGRTALHLAIIAGQVDTVNWLLECEPCLTCQDDEAHSPFFFAYLLEFDEAIAALRATIAKRFFEKDDFFVAIILDNAPVVTKCLSGIKYNVDTFNELGKSCLHVAAEHGNNGIIRLLMQKEGADVNFPCKDNRGTFKRLPIHFAAIADNARTIELLVSLGSRVNDKDARGDMSLHLAAQHGCLQAVIALCEAGAEIDTTNELVDSEAIGRTALHVAIIKEHAHVALELLRRGARFDTVDSEHNTPFSSAQKKAGMEEVIAAMIEASQTHSEEDDSASHTRTTQMLRLEETDNEGNTQLHKAAGQGSARLINQLCDLGANLNAKNSKGRTPMALASLRGQMKSLRALKKRNARPSILDDKGRCILHLAAKQGHDACITTAMPWFNNPDQRDDDEETPLHLAASKHRLTTMQALLEPCKVEQSDSVEEDASESNALATVEMSDQQPLAADPNARNSSDETPFHYLVTMFLEYDEEDDEVIQAYNNQLAPEIELMLAHGGRVDLKNTSDETVVDVADNNDHLSEANKQRLAEAFEQQKDIRFVPRQISDTTSALPTSSDPVEIKPLEQPLIDGTDTLSLSVADASGMEQMLLQMIAEEEVKKQQEDSQQDELIPIDNIAAGESLIQQKQVPTKDDNRDVAADESLTPQKQAPTECDLSDVALDIQPYVRHFHATLQNFSIAAAEQESTAVPQEDIEELTSFIEKLRNTQGLAELGGLLSENDNNLLHFVAAHDPAGLLIPQLKQLPQESLAQMVGTGNANNETPIHTACRHHHLLMFELCVAALNQDDLANLFHAIVSDTTLDSGQNAFHLACLSALDNNAKQIKAQFEMAEEFNTKKFIKLMHTPVEVDEATLRIMYRFREILGERNDEIVATEDWFQQTPLMLCCYAHHAALIKQCLRSFQKAESQKRAIQHKHQTRQMTPIQFACAFATIDCVKALMHPFGNENQHRLCRAQKLLNWCYITADESQDDGARERLTAVLTHVVGAYGPNLERAAIRRVNKTSYLIKSLHGDGIVVRRLLSRDGHIAKRYEILVQLMCDLTSGKPRSPSNSPQSSPRLFNVQSSMLKINRTGLFETLFKFKWPEDIIHNMALTIAAMSRYKLDQQQFDYRHVFLVFINSKLENFHGKPPNERFATFICALFYKLPINRQVNLPEGQTAVDVGNGELVASIEEMAFISHFSQTGMISCIQELYLFLEATNAEAAEADSDQDDEKQQNNPGDLFLSRIYRSNSLLRAALMTAFPFKSRYEKTDEKNFVLAVKYSFTTTQEGFTLL